MAIGSRCGTQRSHSESASAASNQLARGSAGWMGRARCISPSVDGVRWRTDSAARLSYLGCKKEVPMTTILKALLATTAIAFAAQAGAQVVFYDKENFQGRSFTVQKRVTDL